MGNKYTKSDLEYMKDFISDYISENECDYHSMNCSNCGDIEDCYRETNARCNSEFAEVLIMVGTGLKKNFGRYCLVR
jgi:hypothetical protein